MKQELYYKVAKCYFVSKIVRKKCSSDRKKVVKFETKGREFAKILISIGQFIQIVKVFKQNAFFTCSRKFFRSNNLEWLELKLEKIIGI